jgi:hypothetical protein
LRPVDRGCEKDKEGAGVGVGGLGAAQLRCRGVAKCNFAKRESSPHPVDRFTDLGTKVETVKDVKD